MNVGDIFYSVMQKDNNPFAKPRITKFVVEKIFTANSTHPIVATKTDKWGRHYCFKESKIYSNYADAIPEKNEKIEKIKQWEKVVQEINKKHFEEQRKREELEKNQKAIECLEDVRDSVLDISNGWWKCFKDGNQYMTSTDLQGCLEEIIDPKISELKGE